MFAAVMVIVGVVLLAVAGFGFGRPYLVPQWLGLACLALAFYAHSLPGLQ